MITSVPTSASCMILNLTCKVKLCFSSEQPSGKLAHCTYRSVVFSYEVVRRELMTGRPAGSPRTDGFREIADAALECRFSKTEDAAGN